MDPSNDTLEPRREARPLKFEELTGEQSTAGEQATRLLRGMAREPWTPANRQPPVHSYLPVIYKEEHSNRVILLDGARGSGKSALLITLLDAYGRALVEQKAPEHYESWIRPADRIIPVGLLDLQPLPASTHLLFHLVASLERVVEAMETRHETSRPATAAWHPGGDNESDSRQTWKRFARVAASGWSDNLRERKGHLDSEAFAVEVEQGELQRLDVNRAFHEFMDALVTDYRAWNHWASGTTPLFVLAIDDADMNEELSVPLLELVRKLWHPRLVFLLTGDSELFVRRLALTDNTVPDQLALDRYAKVIPLNHRFTLKELEPSQRLLKGPRIEEYFKKIRIPVQRTSPGRPEGNLLDYFQADTPVQAALPGRLRLLEELADRLQSLSLTSTTITPARATIEALRAIWQFALRSEPDETRVNAVLEDDAAGRLFIEGGLSVTWEIEPMISIPTPNGELFLEAPVRATISRGSARKEALGAKTAAALRLALDIIADTGSEVGRIGTGAVRMGKLVLARASLDDYFEGGPLAHPWPVPAWNSFLDIELLRKKWEQAISSLKAPDTHADEQVAKSFLQVILRVGLGEQAKSAQAEGQTTLPTWDELAAQLGSLISNKEAASTRRMRVLASWAMSQAGLLAAPESGLSAETANNLITALYNAFQDVWKNVRPALHKSRRDRAFAQFQAERGQDLDETAVDRFLSNIDRRFTDHRFGQLVEQFEGYDPVRDEVYKNLQNDFRSIRLNFLNDILGRDRSDNALTSYLTPLRSKWLKMAPIALLEEIRNRLASFYVYSDAGAPILLNCWRGACAVVGDSELTGVLQLAQERLIIAGPYRKLLQQRTRQIPTKDVRLRFSHGPAFRLMVHESDHALRPALKLTSAGQGAVHALESILRMAYDHEQDQEQIQSPPKPTRPTRWSGIAVQLPDGLTFHPWVVPSWPTLFEWESLEEGWSTAVQRMTKLVSDDTTDPDIRIVDTMAYFLVLNCQRLQSRGTIDGQLPLKIAASDWRSLIFGGRRKDDQGNLIRDWLYSEWWNQLIFMAAPESGLSKAAAAGILDFIPQSEQSAPEALKQAKATLHHRKARMVEAGVPEAEVNSLLTHIDKSDPTHPWVQRFGVWRSDKKSSGS